MFPRPVDAFDRGVLRPVDDIAGGRLPVGRHWFWLCPRKPVHNIPQEPAHLDDPVHDDETPSITHSAWLLSVWQQNGQTRGCFGWQLHSVTACDETGSCRSTCAGSAPGWCGCGPAGCTRTAQLRRCCPSAPHPRTSAAATVLRPPAGASGTAPGSYGSPPCSSRTSRAVPPGSPRPERGWSCACLRLVLDRVDFEPGVYWLDCGAYAVDWESVYDHRRDWQRLMTIGPPGNGRVQPPLSWDVE